MTRKEWMAFDPELPPRPVTKKRAGRIVLMLAGVGMFAMFMAMKSCSDRRQRQAFECEQLEAFHHLLLTPPPIEPIVQLKP